MFGIEGTQFGSFSLKGITLQTVSKPEFWLRQPLDEMLEIDELPAT